MKEHVSPAEWTAALDGTLAPERALHVEACEACREELADLRRVLADVEAVPVPPEPPPPFWDDLTDRIRGAVGTPAPPRSAWQRWRQPAIALAAAVLLLIWLTGRGAVPDAPAADDVVGAAAPRQASDERWDAVVEIAAELSLDDVHGALPLRRDAVVLFDDLSVDEQAALSDLLERELKGLE